MQARNLAEDSTFFLEYYGQLVAYIDFVQRDRFSDGYKIIYKDPYTRDPEFQWNLSSSNTNTQVSIFNCKLSAYRFSKMSKTSFY